MKVNILLIILLVCYFSGFVNYLLLLMGQVSKASKILRENYCWRTYITVTVLTTVFIIILSIFHPILQTFLFYNIMKNDRGDGVHDA